LLAAPQRGLFVRVFRIAKFRFQCLSENVLKTMWRHGPDSLITIKKIQKFQSASTLYLRFILFRLTLQGWVQKTKSDRYKLTSDGGAKAAHIVRLHRLWEVYLADYVGVGIERVHRSAEEMEHIITPKLERELTKLLKNPKLDPHRQPIPPSPHEERMENESS
jgi:manganese/zinc/iron transport system permease protein